MRKTYIFILIVLIFSVISNNAFSQLYLRWSNIYNSTTGTSEEIPISITAGNSGNVVVTGYTGSLLASSDIVTLKYSTEGSIIWKRTFNAGANIPSQGLSVVHDSSDNFYVAGFCNVTSFQSRLIILKYDSAGNLIWNKFYNHGNDSVTVPSKMLIDSAGYIFICGYTVTLDGKDLLLMKCDTSAADTVWTRTYNNFLNRDDNGTNIIFDNENNIIVGGYTSPNFGQYDYLILKYNHEGISLWEKSFHFLPEDFLRSLGVDKDNNVLVTGGSREYIKGPPPGHYILKSFALTLKYDPAGNLLWNKTDGGECSECAVHEAAFEIRSDASGNIFIAGDSYGKTKTIKYSPTGNVVWKQVYGNSNSIYGKGTNLILDEDSNIYTFGYQDVSSSNSDIFLVKYINSDGSSPWAGTYASPEGKDDIITCVIEGNLKNIYVAGSTINLSGNNDILLLKYNTDPVGITSQNYLVSDFSLYQNYPNPFNPVTNIKFTLPNSTNAILKVIDISGKEIAVLLNKNLKAGEYEFQFSVDNYNLPSGVYFYQLKAGNFSQTKKMILVK